MKDITLLLFNLMFFGLFLMAKPDDINLKDLEKTLAQFRASDDKEAFEHFTYRADTFLKYESTGNSLPNKEFEKQFKYPGKPSLYSGLPYEGWNDFWWVLVKVLPNMQENAEKYVKYVVMKRKALKLPDIERPSPEVIKKRHMEWAKD